MFCVCFFFFSTDPSFHRVAERVGQRSERVVKMESEVTQTTKGKDIVNLLY